MRPEWKTEIMVQVRSHKENPNNMYYELCASLISFIGVMSPAFFQQSLRIILVGKAGLAGKSATGNTILREPGVPSQLKAQPVTTSCHTSAGEHGMGRMLWLWTLHHSVRSSELMGTYPKLKKADEDCGSLL